MRSTKLMFMVSILVPATFFAVAALAIHAAGPTETPLCPRRTIRKRCWPRSRPVIGVEEANGPNAFDETKQNRDGKYRGNVAFGEAGAFKQPTDKAVRFDGKSPSSKFPPTRRLACRRVERA